MATMKKAYLLIRNDVDFDEDKEIPNYIGVFFTKKALNEAKLKDMFKTLNECSHVFDDEKEKVTAAFTGKNKYGYTTRFDKYDVSEDEIRDDNQNHIAPNFAWVIEEVKVELPAK